MSAQEGAWTVVLVQVLQILKLDQHVSWRLSQGTAESWLLQRESLVLLLNMQAKPTSDQQVRACACRCASSIRNSQPHPAMQSPITQMSWRLGVTAAALSPALGGHTKSPGSLPSTRTLHSCQADCRQSYDEASHALTQRPGHCPCCNEKGPRLPTAGCTASTENN